MKPDGLEKRYFLVCCKCGHVGGKRFIRLVYPVRALNAREAAALARQRPGVKHHHPDAVLWVQAVDAAEYRRAERTLRGDIYWQGVRRRLALVADRLEPEPSHETGGTTWDAVAARKFRQTRNRLVEAEVDAYVAREYGTAI